MTRLNQILIVVLVLQLVVAALVILPQTATSSGEVQSLLPGVTVDDIVSLTISLNDGRSIRLARQGNGWVLPDGGDYPVMEDKVPELLDKIVAIKSDRLVTETANSHKRLKVAADDYERLVEIGLQDGSTIRLYVGTSPSYSVSHVRLDGQDEVYLVSGLTATDLGIDSTSWADRSYFVVSRDDVVALTLENANGRFEFTKEGDTWTMAGLAEGEVFNETAFNTVLSRATSVSMLKPLGKEEKAEYGMQSPQATVVLQTHNDQDGDKTYTLTVGAQDPDDKSYVFTTSESPYYVRVNAYSVSELVDETRDSFIEQPTPEAETTPSSSE